MKARLLYILLFAQVLSQTDCFPPELPTFVPSPTSGGHEAKWHTVIIDYDDTTLYLGGHTKTKVHSELPNDIWPLVAAYSIDTGAYLWTHVYTDDSGSLPKQVLAMTLSSSSSSSLVVSGNVEGDNSKVFLYWLSKDTGSQKENGLYVDTSFDW